MKCHVVVVTVLVCTIVNSGATAQQALGSVPQSVLIPKGAIWSYYGPTGEPKGDWKQGEGAEGWHIGRTTIGYDKPDVVTILPSFSEMKKAHPTGEQHGDHTHAGAGNEVSKIYPAVYYRRSFDWDPALLTNGNQVIIGLRCDDACVVFVNGKEAARAHLPDGPVTPYQTQGMMKTAFWTSEISPHLLVSGRNHIAVAVYNATQDDHDHAFNAELVIAPPTASQ